MTLSLTLHGIGKNPMGHFCLLFNCTQEERSEAKKSAELAAELKGQLLIFGEVSSEPEPATRKEPRKPRQAKA